MDSKLSILIVSSPAPSNPSLELIQSVLDSLLLIRGAQSCKITIILDGYVIADKASSKIGKITEDMAIQYEIYCQSLDLLARSDSRLSILRSPQHQGFGQSVRMGLLSFSTKYALILQHDRIFCRSFENLDMVINVMDSDESIRYIGFPTSTSCSHAEQLRCRYNLDYLNSPHSRLQISTSIYLQPLVFWFDSNHICRVDKYLEIFRPFECVPGDIKARLGTRNLKEMVVRKGDFIEDRVGQVQRNFLCGLRDPEAVRRSCKWFGSYLYWDLSEGIEPRVFVAHLRGRKFDPQRASIWRQTVSLRLSAIDDHVSSHTQEFDQQYDLDSLGF